MPGRIPKKCLTLGLCLEYETFIRGVFCPYLCVCVSVRFFLKKIIAGGPQGPPVIFSDNKVHTINIIIHFQIKLKNFLGPKILRVICVLSNIRVICVSIDEIISLFYTYDYFNFLYLNRRLRVSSGKIREPTVAPAKIISTIGSMTALTAA